MPDNCFEPWIDFDDTRPLFELAIIKDEDVVVVEQCRVVLALDNSLSPTPLQRLRFSVDHGNEVEFANGDEEIALFANRFTLHWSNSWVYDSQHRLTGDPTRPHPREGGVGAGPLESDVDRRAVRDCRGLSLFLWYLWVVGQVFGDR